MIFPIISQYSSQYYPNIIQIFTSIWVNYNDLTATTLEITVNRGNHPQIAQQFRIVKYYNLPIYICMYIVTNYIQVGVWLKMQGMAI
jgi:hypothetical protein